MGIHAQYTLGRRRTLADDIQFFLPTLYPHLLADSEDREPTYPEVIDQRLLERMSSWPGDDMEEDDPGGGNVTDEGHDARDEDGI